MMVKIIKTRFDVALYNPLCSGEGALYFHQCSVAAPVRSEAMECFEKPGFIDNFQYHSNNFLHQFIVGGGDPSGRFLLEFFFAM
jgi:hypothetical protein